MVGTSSQKINLDLALGHANSWTAQQTFGAGLKITGTTGGATIDLTSISHNSPHFDGNGNIVFQSSATSGANWGIYDKNGTTMFLAYVDGTKKVATVSNVLDDGVAGNMAILGALVLDWQAGNTGSEFLAIGGSGNIANAQAVIGLSGSGASALSVTSGTQVSLYKLNYNGGSLGSDIRLKDQIVKSDLDFLSVFQRLNVYEYTRKDDPTERREIGLVAQEAENILPQVVDHNGSCGMVGLWQNDLLAAVIGAIKQLDAKITGLKIKE